MLKKLLKSINTFFSTKGDLSNIENYLSKSSNLYDLELKIRELDQAGKYYKFYE